VRQDSKLLVLRRKNSSYMNGYFCLPGGHVEAAETLQQAISRELQEETGIVVLPETWELFCIVQTVIDSRAYMRFIFRTSNWSGNLELGEPHKAEDLGFYEMSELDKLTPSDTLIVQHMNRAGLTYLSLIEKNGKLVQSTVI